MILTFDILSGQQNFLRYNLVNQRLQKGKSNMFCNQKNLRSLPLRFTQLYYFISYKERTGKKVALYGKKIIATVKMTTILSFLFWI